MKVSTQHASSLGVSSLELGKLFTEGLQKIATPPYGSFVLAVVDVSELFIFLSLMCGVYLETIGLKSFGVQISERERESRYFLSGHSFSGVSVMC